MAGAKHLTNAQRIQRSLDMIQALDGDGMRDYVSSFIPHLRLVAADDFAADRSHHHHPRAVFRYTVQPEHCNRMANLHGGAAATLFDFCTSLALAMAPRRGRAGTGTGSVAVGDGAASTDTDTATDAETSVETSAGSEDDDDDEEEEEDVVASWRRLGVSRTLAVTYVRPSPVGTEVLVECELVHSGKRLSSLRGILRRARDGAVLATCEHGKVIADADPPPSKI